MKICELFTKFLIFPRSFLENFSKTVQMVRNQDSKHVRLLAKQRLKSNICILSLHQSSYPWKRTWFLEKETSGWFHKDLCPPHFGWHGVFLQWGTPKPWISILKLSNFGWFGAAPISGTPHTCSHGSLISKKWTFSGCVQNKLTHRLVGPSSHRNWF